MLNSNLQDEKLLTLAGDGVNVDWAALAESFPDRAAAGLKTRFTKLVKNDEGKGQGQWSKEEVIKFVTKVIFNGHIYFFVRMTR